MQSITQVKITLAENVSKLYTRVMPCQCTVYMNATTDNIQYLQFYTNNWATKLMQEELLTQQIVKNPSKLQNFLELSCSETQTNCKQVQYEGAKMTSTLYHVL